MQQCSRRVPSFLPSYLRKELSTEQKLAYHFQTLLNSITEKNSHLLGLNLMEFPTFFYIFINSTNFSSYGSYEDIQMFFPSMLTVQHLFSLFWYFSHLGKSVSSKSRQT